MLKLKQFLTAVSVCAALISNAQMRNFTLFPKKVVVSTPSTTVTALPGSLNANSLYTTGNAVYDENDNLLFAIQNRDVYDGAGIWVGQLPTFRDWALSSESGGYSVDIANEISIVPIPNTCKQYKVFYTMYSLMGAALLDVTINASGGVSVVANNASYKPINQSYGQGVGLAVSKLDANNERFLYYKTYSPKEITRYKISATGSVSKLGVVATINDPYSPTELELTPDGNYLYWGEGNLVKNIDVNTLFANTSFPISSTTTINGLEFFNGMVYVATSTGLYRGTINLITGQFGTFNKYSQILTAVNSELEVGVNNKLYGVLSGKLFSLTSLEVLETNLATVNSDGKFPYVYTLNDQIDGESYSNFNGVPALSFTALKVNAINVMNSSSSSPLKLYNCKAISLTSTASATSYKVEIFNHTDANGIYTTTGTPVYNSNFITGNLPATLNLKALPGTNGNYLANNSGFLKVRVTILNACTSAIKDIYFNVPVNPTSAIIAVQLNQPNGIPVNMNKVLPGQAMGLYSGSYNLAQSMGDIEFHTVQIDQVDPATGTKLNTILPLLKTNLTESVSNLTALPLNGLNIPPVATLNWAGGPGFFAGPGQMKTYKITMGVGNICNTSTNWSYITPNIYARKADVVFEEQVETEKVYPNPFTTATTISIPLHEYEKLTSFDLINSTGMVISTKTEINETSSEVEIQVSGDNLETGIYTYRCATNQAVYQGKIMKH